MLINVGEDRQTVERAVRQRRYDVPVLLDEQGEARRGFSVRATPTVLLLGREGTLLGAAVGPRGWTEPGGRRLLDALVTCKKPG